MGVEIYKVERWPVIEGTFAAYDSLYHTGLALGRWSTDDVMSLEMPGSEQVWLEELVEQATGGQEWDLALCDQALSARMGRPLVYHMYLDLLEAQASDLPSCHPALLVTTPRLRDTLLRSGVRAAVYPVAVLDRALLRGAREEEVLAAFDREANVRYHVVHLLNILDLFDEQRSDRKAGKFVLSGPVPALPPFFTVKWGPIGSLLVTVEGREMLEQVGLQGFRFIGLNVEELESTSGSRV